MAKPIFIIKLPQSISDEEYYSTLGDLEKDSTAIEIKKEYHVLLLLSNEDKLEFEVLNSDKADEVTIEKVKEIELLITKNQKDGKF